MATNYHSACEHYCEGHCVYTQKDIPVGIFEPCIYEKLQEPARTQQMRDCPQLVVIRHLDSLALAHDEAALL